MKKLLGIIVLILITHCVFAKPTDHLHLRGVWYCYAFSDELNNAKYDFPSGKPYLLIQEEKIINYADRVGNGIYTIASSELNYVNKHKYVYIKFVDRNEWWLIEENFIKRGMIILSVIKNNKILYNILLGPALKENTF